MSVSYSELRGVNNRERSNLRVPANGSNINPRPTDVTSPLLSSAAPMAKHDEIDDGLDDREVVSTPYPGVDDGFFNNSDNSDKGEGKNPDVETIRPKPVPKHPEVETINPKHPEYPGPEVDAVPSHPKDPEPIEPTDEIPHLTPRLGPDGENNPDEADGKGDDGKNDEGTHEEGEHRSRSPFPPHKHGFPYAPSFGHDLEIGSIPGDLNSIPDVNIYQHKKTLAQGMMDLALFSANANQLRYVLESYSRHPYYYPSVIFISMSLMLQVAIGIGLVWNATYNVKDDKEICIANKINNFTVIGIFLVTVVNVFVSAFGVANPPT